MTFDKKLVGHKVITDSVMDNPSTLWTILPKPTNGIEFKSKVINADKMDFEIIIEYGINGHFKTFGLPQSDNPKPFTFTKFVTSSTFEITSDNGHFSNGRFEYNNEFEKIVTDISLIAINYNSTLLKERLKETEMADYEILEFAESTIRAMIRQKIFGKN